MGVGGEWYVVWVLKMVGGVWSSGVRVFFLLSMRVVVLLGVGLLLFPVGALLLFIISCTLRAGFDFDITSCA